MHGVIFCFILLAIYPIESYHILLQHKELTDKMKKITAALVILLIALHLFAEEKNTDPLSGIAVHEDNTVMFTMALVRDFDAFLSEWKNASKSRPRIETASTIKPGETLIPVIFYSIRKRGQTFPIYCDADLIKPDGTVSKTDHTVKRQIINEDRNSDNIFLINNLFGFLITDKYKKGRYKVRVRVYNAKKQICVLESFVSVENE